MPTTVLLDLGNVVLGIDFKRVFAHWAEAAAVDVERFYERWQLDDAYKAHEVGSLSFTDYSQHLGAVFDVRLSPAQWRDGWNSLWTRPHQQVVELLPAIKARYGLYAFSNTNATHATCFRQIYPQALADFQHVYVSNELGARKPDVSAYHQVCSAMGVQPAQVLFIDDNTENVVGAEAAGLQAVHATTEAEVVTALRGLL